MVFRRSQTYWSDRQRMGMVGRATARCSDFIALALIRLLAASSSTPVVASGIDWCITD
jgi:hypothetical protein